MPRKLTKQEPLVVVEDSTWDMTKAWFKRSETIFLARLVATIGFITSTVGAMDFSPFWTMFSAGTDFTPKQLLWMGIGVAGAGVTFELARRRNTETLPDGSIGPKD